MPEYLAPGVYVEEVDTGDKPIEGVSTSTAGMVGVTMRGPVGVPTLVTSVADYRRQFGGRLDHHDYPDSSYLPLAVEGFFNNGGKRVYIVRVLPDATTATYATSRVFDRGDGAVRWSTQLANVAAQGDRLLLIDRPAVAITSTSWFVIEDGTGAEYAQVQPGSPIALGTPVATTVAAGATITGYTLAPSGAVKTLAAPARAGDQMIQVNSVAGIAQNDLVQIDNGLAQEVVRVNTPVPPSAANPNGQVPLYTPLAFDHIPGVAPINVQPINATATGGATTAVFDAPGGSRLIPVADRKQLPPGGGAISIGTAPNDEWHVFFDGGIITSSNPLDFVHPVGSLVTVATLTNLANPNRTVSADAQFGDTSLTLNDVTNVVARTVLQLGAAPGPYEYAVVRAVTGKVVDLYAPIQTAHASGTPAVVANDTTPAAAATTHLVRQAQPGEVGVYVLDTASFPAGTLLRIGQGDLAEYHLAAATPVIEAILLRAALTGSHGAGAKVTGRAVTALMQATDRGAWGNCLQIKCADDDPVLDTTPAESKRAGSPDLALTSAGGIEPGTVLEFYRRAGGAVTSIGFQKVDGRAGNTVQFSPPGLGFAVDKTTMRVKTREFQITVQCVQTNPKTQQTTVSPDMNETIRHLSMDPRHSRYFQKVIGPIPASADGQTEGESGLIRVQDRLSAAAAQSTRRLGPDTLAFNLSGGDDDVGGIVDTTFIGNPSLDPTQRTGIYALQNIEEISIVAVPGQTVQSVQEEVITHCELMRYRVGVLDSALADNFQTVQQHRDLFDSKYAAFYYPWLQIEDPFPPHPRVPGPFLIPASGHMIGIYARTDITRGVHKAPANEVVQSIDDLQVHILKEQQDILNPRAINVIRDFRDHGRGLRVWGARCITSDPDWRYVNVRRLFCFLERSIDNGTQWVVFEPNDQRLWARVRQSVISFLTDVWRSGALMGTRPEQAFFVKCDETTMTQGDIDNGRLIMIIGVAPVRPAEFVIIRIGQWAGGSMVQEP